MTRAHKATGRRIVIRMACLALFTAIVAIPYWELSSQIKTWSQACNDIAAYGGHVRWLMWNPKYIDLTGTTISDETIHRMSAAFDKLQTVEQVIITNTSMTPEGMLKLRRLRGVNRIALIDNPEISANEIDSLKDDLFPIEIFRIEKGE